VKGDQSDDYEWEDEFEEEENISDQEHVEDISPQEEPTDESQISQKENSESKEDLRARLAAEAKRTGVMQAAPGTEQGKTGWYIDSDGQLTSWLVSESGEWTRVS